MHNLYMETRTFPLTDTEVALLYCHRLLKHGREFTVKCWTNHVDVTVHLNGNDLSVEEYPHKRWVVK